MELCVVSIANVDIRIREQVSFTDTMKLQLQKQLQDAGIHTCVIVSTCNRSEVYCMEEEGQASVLLDIYREFFHLPASVGVDVFTGLQAIHHLFALVCGLHSKILGEDQIVKQVKDAYEFSCHSGCVNKQMHLLFQEAFHVAKEVKHHVKISEHPRSTSYIAMKYLMQETSLQDKNVMLCGGGEVITQCLPYLQDAHVRHMYLAIRNLKKAEALKEAFPSITIVPFQARMQYLKEMDIVISATASPHVIFPKEMFCQDEKERWLIDLALPRDMDPACKGIPYLHMYDIDDIQERANYHEEQRTLLSQEAWAYVERFAAQAAKKLQETEKEPLIAHMQQYLSSMAEDTYELLNKKLQLESHEQRMVKKTLQYSYLRFLKDWLYIIDHTPNTHKETLTAIMKQLQEEHG